MKISIFKIYTLKKKNVKVISHFLIYPNIHSIFNHIVLQYRHLHFFTYSLKFFLWCLPVLVWLYPDVEDVLIYIVLRNKKGQMCTISQIKLNKTKAQELKIKNELHDVLDNFIILLNSILNILIFSQLLFRKDIFVL